MNVCVFLWFGRSSGVDKLKRLIKENGWSDASGALSVFPFDEDLPLFKECVPHFLAIQAQEGSLLDGQGWLKLFSSLQSPYGFIVSCGPKNATLKD
jgi:hypothetical protein